MYPVIGEPPFKLGVDQVALTLLPLTVTVGAEGAEGTEGVDEAAKSTGSEDPSELFATILNVYSVESDKPVIVVEVSVLDKFLVVTPLAVTVYPVSENPPVFVGAVQLNFICLAPVVGVLTFGEAGTDFGVNGALGAALEPSLFFASTVKS